MIPFSFNENRFSFFVADHLLVGQLSESDTMFNERDRVAPLYNHASCRSSYDNGTIASTPKMHHTPHIFEVGLKVNTKVYMHVLKSVVIHWYNQVAGGRPWVWQQDSASAHKSKQTQAWLQKECYDFVPFSHWPPSSSDLNPLDSFVWSYVENITNMTPHNTKDSLITTIRRVFAELPPALVEKACS